MESEQTKEQQTSGYTVTSKEELTQSRYSPEIKRFDVKLESGQIIKISLHELEELISNSKEMVINGEVFANLLLEKKSNAKQALDSGKKEKPQPLPPTPTNNSDVKPEKGQRIVVSLEEFVKLLPQLGDLEINGKVYPRLKK